MTLLDVVMKLTGPVEPVGCSNEDAKRYENLKQLLELAGHIHLMIDDIAADFKDRPEASMKKAGVLCQKYLDDLGIPE